MAGLQDMAPMVAKRWVTKAVVAPIRAAALAASQPAWPPPMTITSNWSDVEIDLEIMPRLLSRSHKTRKRKLWRNDRLFHVKHARFLKLFHVKQASCRLNHEILFPDTKLAKDL